MISGIYNEAGYAILSNGEPIYSAGNSPNDSQVYMGAGADHSLGLETIRDYCKRTAIELALERHEGSGSVEYDSEAELSFVGG